ncbi:MAG: hypothetical protein NVS3B15_17400 [Sediminibacterium sp.]
MGNNDTVNNRKFSYVFDNAGDYSAGLTVQSKSGCIATTKAQFHAVVYAFPKANINAISEACKDQLLKLTPSVNSQDSIAYLLWNLGNGLKTKDSLVHVQYYVDGEYTVKLLIATVNHCFDSAYKQITIHPVPVVTLPAEPTICKGDSVQLRANGAMNYIWKDQYEKMICNGCSIPTVKPINSIGYKVIGYNEYGCSEINTINVRVIQPLKMLASPGDTICAGDSRQLFATGAANYTWIPETGLSNKNAATPIARPLVTTTYQVIGKDNFKCFTDTAEVKIVVGYPTPITLGKDTVIMAGSTLQLTAQAARPDIRKWRWSGVPGLSCLNCPEPQVRLSQDACISCVAINRYGCPSSDTICIRTFCAATEVFIPNTFTPDGDGINDLLMVQGKGIKMVKSFRIFNRWGEVVFEKTNFSPGDPAYAWDGKVRGVAASPDVFVYVCEVICEKGLPSIFKGNVAIIK